MLRGLSGRLGRGCVRIRDRGETTLKSEIALEIGRYRILSELGRGSMGCVYLAEDPNIDRKVALKVFAPDGISPETETEFQQRFVTEAKAAGRLNHPGIVTIYDAGTDAATGSSFIAMEWVRGRTLHEHLWHHGGRLSPATAAEFVRQAALALDYAHREGVVHRDVKPANILVGNDGRIRVMDFGVAKLAREDLTSAGVVLGTPAYMAPEQVRTGKVDGRSDLFSLGTILYECLTGKNPFSAAALSEITFKVVNDQVRPPRELDAAIPEALSRVAERALMKSPEERFQTGAELARALEAAAATCEPVMEALEDLGDLEGLPALDSTVISAGSASASPRRALGWAAAGAVAVALAAWVLLGRSSPASSAAAGVPSPARGPDHESAVRAPAETAENPKPAPREDPAREDSAREDSAREDSAREDSAREDSAREDSAREGLAREGPLEAAAPGAAGGERKPRATLDVLYVNRLREGRIRVRIDGVEVWSREVSARNPFKRLGAGQRHYVTLPVEAGERAIEVRITAPSGIDARQTIHGTLVAGKVRQLQVTLKRRANEIELDWTD